MKVIRHEMQQQKKKKGNCGLFALAFALNFCMTGKVSASELWLKEDIMRKHLIKWFHTSKLVVRDYYAVALVT